MPEDWLIAASYIKELTSAVRTTEFLKCSQVVLMFNSPRVVTDHAFRQAPTSIWGFAKFVASMVRYERATHSAMTCVGHSLYHSSSSQSSKL